MSLSSVVNVALTTAMAKRSEYLGHTGIFYVGSALAVFAAIITLIFVPNIKPDYMINEDALFREYLAKHGYDVSQMGEPEARDVDFEAEKAEGAKAF